MSLMGRWPKFPFQLRPFGIRDRNSAVLCTVGPKMESSATQNGKNRGMTHIAATVISRFSGAPTRKKSLKRYPPGP
jgi:hypothetical protein